LGHAGLAQCIKQAWNDPVGPFLPRVWRPVLIMQIAEMIAQIIGKRFFRELDRDGQQVVFLGQRQPVIAVGRAIAADAVMHEQHRRSRRVLPRPRGVQIQRLLRKRGVVPAEGIGAGEGDQLPRVWRLVQPALATARPAITPTRWARYSELAWISPFRSFGGVLIPLIAAAEKLPVSAFSISA